MDIARAWTLMIAVALLIVSCGGPQSAVRSDAEVFPTATITERPASTALPTAFPTNLTHYSGPYFGQTAPGALPTGFAPGMIYGDLHTSPVFTPDGHEAYWALWSRGIQVSRLENGYWTRPEKVAFSSSMTNYRDPFLAPSGNRLFFLSDDPLPNSTLPEKENIWFVDRTESGWGEPQPVSEDVNIHELHWQVSVNNEGDLYFTSRLSGCEDIYYSRYVDGQHIKPERLSDSINTADFCETTPYIAPDSSYLIFSRWDQADNGANIKLYISFAGEDGGWTEAALIEQIWYGLCPVVSPDGKFLFFLSSPHSISWMSTEFIDEMRSGG